jgi:2,3-bisphosphoglycerate-dependent phosphoglycerate mutase
MVLANGTYRIALPAGMMSIWQTQASLNHARLDKRCVTHAGFQFDTAYTSLLKRAIRTLWVVLDQLDQMWIPVVRDWRLNERHYYLADENMLKDAMAEVAKQGKAK